VRFKFERAGWIVAGLLVVAVAVDAEGQTAKSAESTKSTAKSPKTGAGPTPDLRMVEAARSQDRALIDAALKQHANVNAAQADGSTALHWAVYWEDLDTTDRLLRAGAKAGAVNELGVTPLVLACSNSNARSCRSCWRPVPTRTRHLKAVRPRSCSPRATA